MDENHDAEIAERATELLIDCRIRIEAARLGAEMLSRKLEGVQFKKEFDAWQTLLKRLETDFVLLGVFMSKHLGLRNYEGGEK